MQFGIGGGGGGGGDWRIFVMSSGCYGACTCTRIYMHYILHTFSTVYFTYYKHMLIMFTSITKT